MYVVEPEHGFDMVENMSVDVVDSDVVVVEEEVRDVREVVWL